MSTAVVKVDVINASLSQNQCLQCVSPASINADIPRPRDATELNNDSMHDQVGRHLAAGREFQAAGQKRT